MGKSKLRNSSDCKNCVICTKVSKMHEYNNISDLLNKVEIWDTDFSNQFKKVKLIYHCLVCNFETLVFNVWKCHIMSISHLESSHKIKNLQSHVCTQKDCKFIIYGEQSCINSFKNTNSLRSEGNKIGIPILMSEVMNRFFQNKHKLLYFCSHCKKFKDTQMHAYVKELVTRIKTPYDYFCKFCKVQFYCSPEMIDLHSLTVEHLTLKCFDHLCSTAKMNPKKIKLSEQLDQPSKTEKLNIVQNWDIQLPNKPEIVFNRFKSTTNGLCECKLCGSSVIWHIKSLVSHLSNCQYYYDFTDLNNINIISKYTFECTLCNYSTADITNHIKHVISAQHIVNCYRTKNNFSYFCMECNLFMYSNKLVINHHMAVFHNISILKNFTFCTFMASNFNDINRNPNKTDILHYHGDQDSSASSKVSFLCFTCKIEFHTSIHDYNIHMITSEHILLRFVSPKTLATKENNGATTVITPAIKKPIVKDQRQKNDSIKILKTDSKEHENNALVNKKSTNLDDKGIPSPLVDVKELQSLCIKNVLPDKTYENALNGSIESNSDIKLTLGNKQLFDQYTKYFKHKMKLLNLLRQYKDRVLNTLSYYCIECDIMCEEKPIWDKHNEAKHTNHSTRPTVHCSTCSMLIVGENANNHNKTIEHCILLKFIQSLKPIEEDLIKKTTIMEYVKGSTSIGLETEKEKPNVDIVGSTKEIFQCPIENIMSNVGIYNIQKSSIFNDGNVVMKNTSLPKDKDVNHNKYEMNLSTSNTVKKLNEMTLSPNNFTSITPTTVLHQTNVKLNNQKNVNLMDNQQFMDDGQCEHKVDKTIVCDLVQFNENTSTSSNSLNVPVTPSSSLNAPVTPSSSLNAPVTVLHQTDANVKKYEEITSVDLCLPTYDSDLHKEALTLVENKIIPEKVADDRSKNEFDSIFGEATLSLDMPMEVSTLVKNKENSHFFYEDYGEYTEFTFKNTAVQPDDTKSEPVKRLQEINLSPSHTTPPTTVLHQTNVELKKQKNMHGIDILKIKDDDQCEHEVDKTIVCDPLNLHENTSSSYSLNVPVKVKNPTNADVKKHNEITSVDLFLLTHDLDLHKKALALVQNKIISEKVADDKLQNEVDLISGKTTLSLDLPIEILTLLKDKKTSCSFNKDSRDFTELMFKDAVVQQDDTQSKLFNLGENPKPKEEINKNEMNLSISNPVKKLDEITLSPNHFTSTPPITVLNQTNVELNNQENVNLIDNQQFMDDGQCEHEVDNTIVCDPAKLHENPSTSSNSLNMPVIHSNSLSVPVTVLHQTDTDMKKHEEITSVNLFLHTCDLDLHKEALNLVENKIPKKVTDDRSQNEVDSISDKTTLSLDLSTEVSTLVKMKETSHVYNKDYGECTVPSFKNTVVNQQDISQSKICSQAETKIMPEDIDMEPHNDVASLFDQSTVSLLAHVSKVFKTKQDSVLTDEDKAYGNYVITRLKYFKDKAVRRDIKLKTLDFLKSNIIPEQILSETSKNITLLLDPALTNMSNENIDRFDIDEDSEYGRYVTQRLGNIKNQELKHDIKLEIDNIFYTKTRSSTIIP